MTPQEQLDAILATGIASVNVEGFHVRSGDFVAYSVRLYVGPDYHGHGYDDTMDGSLREAIAALRRGMIERRAPTKAHRAILEVCSNTSNP